MEWKITSVIKARNKETGGWHSNIVGTMKIGTREQIEDGTACEYIYKVSRLPNWRPFWEFLVSNEIHTHIPGIKHFARVTNAQKIAFDVDRNWKTLPSSNSKRQCDRYVMIQKRISGLSLAKHITFGCSQDFFVSATLQVLMAQHIAQQVLGKTHYDLHGNNVLMQPERILESSRGVNLFYFYDFDDEPVVVPSKGYRAKIIDYEFSYVHACKGKPFDSQFNLLERCYVPCSQDRGYDALRFFVSCCTYMYERTKNQTCNAFAKEIILETEKYSRKVGGDGLLSQEFDYVRMDLMRMFKKGTDAHAFVDNKYYYLLSLLLHNASVPFKKFVEKVLQLDKNQEKCCIAIFEFIDGQRDLIEEKGELWVAELRFLITSCVDLVQSLYAEQVQDIRSEREKVENVHTPMNVLKRMSTRFEIKTNIKNGDIVFWMKPEKREKIVLKLDHDDIQLLNVNYDIFRRGKLFRKLL